MKRLITVLSIISCFFLITSCAKNTSEQGTVQENETANQEHEAVQEEISAYPVVLSEEEKNSFIEKVEGFWTAFEFPGVEEVTPGNYEYDWHPQALNIYKDSEGSVSIAYDITPSLNGNWYQVKDVVQEDDVTFRFNVESYDISYKDGENGEEHVFPNAWPDIDYFTIILSDEESNRIQLKTSFKENKDVFFYSGTESSSNYRDWLRSNGFFVNDFNDPIENKLWPNGYGAAQADLHEAKQIIEDYGLTFDTDIPQSEWNDPKEYHFSYIIDGKEYYTSWFSCKLGTKVFFSYN